MIFNENCTYIFYSIFKILFHQGQARYARKWRKKGCQDGISWRRKVHSILLARGWLNCETVNAGNLGAFTTPKGIGNLIAEASKDVKLGSFEGARKRLRCCSKASFFLLKLNMKKKAKRENTFVGSVDINKISLRSCKLESEAFITNYKEWRSSAHFSSEWLLIDFQLYAEKNRIFFWQRLSSWI